MLNCVGYCLINPDGYNKIGMIFDVERILLVPGFILPLELPLTIVILIFVQVLLPIVSVLTGVYFLIIFLSSPRRPKRPLPTGTPVKRILVLVPARNEAKVINRLLDSLRQVSYPAGLLDVLVLADNCTDQTADVAREAGFKVMVRNDLSGQSKAFALHWAFYRQNLINAGYDAITILDADSIVDPNFFRYVEAELRQGTQVIQGNRGALNTGESVFTSAMSILYSFESRLWYTPHANHNLSTLLLGSGSTIACEHLRLIGWDIRTLVEDAEFSIQTVLAGVHIQFCDEARLQAEIPPTLRLIWRQLRRWFSGQIACGRFYLPAIWNKVWQDRGGQASLHLVTLIIPFNCTLGLLQIFLSAVTSYELVGGNVPLPVLLSGLLINQLSGMAAALFVLHMDGRLKANQLKSLWKGILVFPYWSLFMGLIYLVSFLFPKKKWELMDHNPDKSPGSPAS
jgi:cellulose synthase/poly-beta-1,6-N-acetylglucosamine synthase-like glycosyltransferase